jgi:general secretion pathway protein A
MFLSYFHLAEQPFGATPDPRFLFQSASHRETLASLYCAFCANRGFTALIAEPGMGKTTLLLEFLDYIHDHASTVFLSNPLCKSDNILSLILYDLGITPSHAVANRHRQLNEVVLSEARSGRRLVLIIDEAQNLSVHALELVRLLTNFETPRSKLIQIVLAGQPQLADTLSRPEVAQLLQRISTVCRLERFSNAETAAYIEHRLTKAGHTGANLFTAGAIQLIAEASHGIPRTINTLCFNALCICRARNSKLVEESMVGESICDLQLPSYRGAPSNVQAPTEIPVPFIPHTSEIRLSASRLAWYSAKMSAGICAALTGVHMWTTRVQCWFRGVLGGIPIQRLTGWLLRNVGFWKASCRDRANDGV